MRVVVERLEEPRGGALHQRPRMEIAGLFGDRHRADRLLCRDDPADAKSRGQRFREGAQVDHRRTAVDRGDGWHVRARKTQLAIGVVFQHRDAVFRRQPRELLATLEAQRGALRVLERRDDIDEPGPRAPDGALELVDAHPVLVASHGHEVRVVRFEDLQRRDVRGVLDDHRVARVEKNARHQIDALL